MSDTSDTIEEQAAMLHRAVSDLIRRYQFRDRQEICCHGISVSQCYALTALADRGQLTMGELAGLMQLTVSTMTRAVDQLVKKEYVERCVAPADRRVCCVQLTGEGRALVEQINGELLAVEKGVLEQIDPAARAGVVRAIELLRGAIDTWREQAKCC